MRQAHRQTREARTKEHLASKSNNSSIRETPAELSNQTKSRLAVFTSNETVDKRPDAKSFLLTALGQGRLDPFNVYPDQDIPVYIHEVLDHGEHLSIQKVPP
jgi:hypothetical protein